MGPQADKATIKALRSQVADLPLREAQRNQKDFKGTGASEEQQGPLYTPQQAPLSKPTHVPPKLNPPARMASPGTLVPWQLCDS